MPAATTLGAFLVQLRGRRFQTTIARLCNRTGVTQQTLSRFERDIRRPDAAQLAAILHALDATDAEQLTALRLARETLVEVA